LAGYIFLGFKRKMSHLQMGQGSICKREGPIYKWELYANGG